MTEARTHPAARTDLLRCAKCNRPSHAGKLDDDGGLFVLFECGGVRYWERMCLDSGASPLQPVNGCRNKTLPTFALVALWEIRRPK